MPKVYHVQVQSTIKKPAEERLSVLGNYINLYNSNYLLLTDSSAQSIYEHLSAGLENPTILIFECNIKANAYYGRANKAIWDWITEVRPKIK